MLHPSTFEYLKPTDAQIERMAILREAAKVYADTVDALLLDGPDKTFVLRAHRANAMWVNVAVTRQADGTPRVDDTPGLFPPKPDNTAYLAEQRRKRDADDAVDTERRRDAERVYPAPTGKD